MNLQEKEMLAILKEGKEKYSYVGVKAEFEAEGSRKDEVLRLSEIVRKSGLNLGIKIGGCEAISDLYKTKLIGVEYIIAPMVETPYALSKYIEAKNKVFTKEERQDVRFLFNLETITAFNNLDDIIKTAKTKDGADGIVFGRTDFIGSIEYKENKKISGKEITDYLVKTAAICKLNKLDFVIGGGVSKETIDPVCEANKVYLSRFETRKVIFNTGILSKKELNKALELALKFELLWLQNKQDHYFAITKEDEARIRKIKSIIE